MKSEQDACVFWRGQTPHRLFSSAGEGSRFSDCYFMHLRTSSLLFTPSKHLVSRSTSLAGVLPQCSLKKSAAFESRGLPSNTAAFLTATRNFSHAPASAAWAEPARDRAAR